MNNLSIEKVISILDEMDATKFGELLTEDSVFVNGNYPAIEGKSEIFKAQTEFFKAIKGMSHTIKRKWEASDSVAVEMIVTYTKHDNSVVSLPVTDVYTFKDGKVSGIYIYMDINPLFAE